MEWKDAEKSINFPDAEKEIIEKWEKDSTFEKSLARNKGRRQFVIYDGPPFATGLPHYGHILPGTIKDIVPRYQTMKGQYVPRRWGWDCHGLPVENLIEKELNLNSKKEILAYGEDKFNEACRASVLKYANEWEKSVTRMGRWVEFKGSYKTMDADFMETIWWVFKTLWEKGLIYEGFKILPYCCRCTTPLSNFETNQGYKDVQDPAVTVAFQLKEQSDTYILAWTTTPWTLPSNTGLAVGEDIDYIKVEDDGKYYIMAEVLANRYYKNPNELKIAAKMKGSELVGLHYIPLFPYFAALGNEGAFRVVIGHHVTVESGTGIVHIAPGFGEDDAEIGRKEGLPALCPIDAEGKFTAEVTDYQGEYVKSLDKTIIKRLKEEGKLIKQETYQHSYPHCWRCEQPLIYKAVSSWFVSIDKIKETMIAANQKVNWVPEHIKNGRFGKWLEGARDWAISRNRYWGSPIPVWKCPDCGEVICVGSIDELYQLSGVKLDDLHKHFVDKITFPCKKCGAKMQRVDEVLDCWFESGSMPYAQNHYPFENKEAFDATFPADFIAEGLDQTRGWFYTLTVLGAALFGQSPMKNVVVNGLVLAEDGRKMSKRLKNYPEVDYIFNKYGADALRLFLMNSAAIKAGELLFSEKGVEDVIKRYHLPLWNTYSFFVTYAKVDNWTPENQDNNYKNPLDIWLQSYTEKLAADCDKALGEYDFQTAVRSLYDYIDNLTNWYVRRSRRRFWKSEDDNDKKQAYTALYNALITFCKAAAPIAPFLSEKIYGALRTENMSESVHLCDYPTGDASKRDLTIEREMELVQRVVEMGRSLRAKVGINLRKPLNAVYIITRNQDEMDLMRKMESIVKEELNVKNVVYETEEEKLVSLSCKANFRVLGKKVGKSMKAVAAVIAGFGAKEAAMIENGTSVTVNVDGNTFELTAEDVIIDRKEKEGLTVQNEGTLTIALDTKLTQELIDEGIAREFIRAVQNLRKERGFDVTDRIKIVYEANERVNNAVDNNESIIKNETLAVEITKAAPVNVSTADVDEENIKLDVIKS